VRQRVLQNRRPRQYGGQRAGRQAMRILLVEDDEVIANGLSRSLRQAGYAVDHLVSGYRAHNALGLDASDPVILDPG